MAQLSRFISSFLSVAVGNKAEQLAALDEKYERVFPGKWARYSWGNFVTGEHCSTQSAAVEDLQPRRITQNGAG
jgi:hypothetical protein